MNTLNVVSTPNITGNVGSCSTQVVTAESARLSLWKTERTTIATNSCTGHVTTYTTWSFTGAWAFGVFCLLCLAIGFMKLFLHLLTPKEERRAEHWF